MNFGAVLSFVLYPSLMKAMQPAAVLKLINLDTQI